MSQINIDLPDEIKVFYLSGMFRVYAIENDGAQIRVTATNIFLGEEMYRTDIWNYSFRLGQYILDVVGDWQNVR